MLKVCHMTSVHPAEDVRIFHKECVSLAAAGYDVYLVEQGDSYEKKGVKIIGVGPMPAGRLRRMTDMARRVYKAALAIDADVYHIHDPELLPYAMKFKRRGKTVIFDSHERYALMIREKTYLPALVRNVIASIYEVYEKYIFRRIDAVITVTPNIMDYYLAIQPNTALITNFPLLDSEPDPDQSEPRERRIAFAGGVTEEWNQHVIMQVLERLPDCRYVLCGIGDDEAYMQRLKSSKGWNQVDYRGRIPHAEVSAILRSSSVGMALSSPSLNSDGDTGTLGNTKIFEEMMAELPVVCTGYKLWREFIEGYQCGICVDPKNVEEVAEAVRYLLDHPDEARQMGQNGRRAVKEHFNWGVEEKKLLALYETVQKQ